MPKKVQGQFKFGFADSDLKTQKHDEIMIALDEQMPQIVADLFKGSPLPQERIKEFEEQGCPEELINQLKEFKASRKNIKLTWEYPIINKNKFVIGFADMKMVYTRPRPIKREGEWEMQPLVSTKYFEVKSTIKSLGELIRQIRYYQTIIDESFIVVCPEIQYSDQLKRQGLDLIHYNNGSFEWAPLSGIKDPQ